MYKLSLQKGKSSVIGLCPLLQFDRNRMAWRQLGLPCVKIDLDSWIGKNKLLRTYIVAINNNLTTLLLLLFFRSFQNTSTKAKFINVIWIVRLFEKADDELVNIVSYVSYLLWSLWDHTLLINSWIITMIILSYFTFATLTAVEKSLVILFALCLKKQI